MVRCIYCKSSTVKFGMDRKKKQRFLCVTCRKTFTSLRKSDAKITNEIRLTFHLILAGCRPSEIADQLNISIARINRYKRMYTKYWKKILPAEQLLSFTTLFNILSGIEKKRIASILFKKRIH